MNSSDNVEELTSFDKIDYIIVNHVEMDHSGSLPTIAKLAKNAKIIASERGKDALIEHYGHDFNKVETVKTGDELNLGKRTLQFLETPMLHWPDSMFSYLIEDKILFSNDAFGEHFASSERFDDEVDQQRLWEEAATYYANILMLFAPLDNAQDTRGRADGNPHRNHCPRPRSNLAKRPSENNQRLHAVEFRQCKPKSHNCF